MDEALPLGAQVYDLEYRLEDLADAHDGYGKAVDDIIPLLSKMSEAIRELQREVARLRA